MKTLKFKRAGDRPRIMGGGGVGASTQLLAGNSGSHSSQHDTHLCRTQAGLFCFSPNSGSGLLSRSMCSLLRMITAVYIPFHSLTSPYLVNPLISDCSKFHHYNSDLITGYRYVETNSHDLEFLCVWSCIVERVLKDVENYSLSSIKLARIF